jgi:cobalt/nickel transport system permease protein
MGASFWFCRRGGQWWSFARVLLRRAAVVWVFAGLMALGSLGQPDWPLRAGNLLLKSTLSLWAISLLAHCTCLPDLVSGLRYLGAPRVWTETFAFWGRYFAVLSEEWRRMQLARRARTFAPGPRRQFKALSNTLGLLFIRAYERAEQVHRAMLARGHRDGE